MNAAPMPCEACGHDTMRSSGWVLRCSACGFLVSTLEPAAGAGVEGLDELRRRNFAALLDRLETRGLPAGARLLEVGCATGEFLALAAARGLDVEGIEPQEAAAQQARRKGLSVRTGYFPGDLATRDPFDLIVFNDVFEHLPNPSSVIRDVEVRLTPNGRVVINVPSSDGVLFRIASRLDRFGLHGPYERLWQKGLASPHVSYFNAANLRRLVERHTRLTLCDAFTLPSVHRTALLERIGASHRGLPAYFLYMGMWTLSFALPHLPSDIVVSVFQKS